jgi:hypothetical protein
MEAVKKRTGEGKGLYLHAGNMLNCMRSRELPNADIAIGAEVAKMSHIANISCRVGAALNWDNEAGQFIGNDSANRLIKANYRAPWKLPQL